MNWIAPTVSFSENPTFGTRQGFLLCRGRKSKTTDALKHMRTDNDDVVSFEYVIVTACVVTAVGTAFKTGASGPVKDALTSALNIIKAAVATSVGG